MPRRHTNAADRLGDIRWDKKKIASIMKTLGKPVKEEPIVEPTPKRGLRVKNKPID